MFVKFPACTHHFCVDCSRDMLFWDERRHHINPVQYGCESCGCPNPEMGPQCHCKMRFLNIAKWAVNNTDKYQEWKEAEQKELLIGSRWAYGVKKCPLCKAEC
jgi:hypothetical protein